jgi:hypothetical protein
MASQEAPPSSRQWVTNWPVSFRRENTVLIDACRSGLRPPLPLNDLDWEYVLAAANRQGVAPLLRQRLADRSSTKIPDAIRVRLDQAYWATHFRNRTLHLRLLDIQRECAREGIRLMPLKGALMAWGFYPQPSLRPMSDLDLLVREDDLDACGALLRRLEYYPVDDTPSHVTEARLHRASREYRWMQRKTHTMVECRVEPLEPVPLRFADLDAGLTATLREHAAGVWARATTSAEGNAMPQMAAEDAVLHIAAHLAAKHGDLRLIWLRDLAEMLERSPRFDWASLSRRARACRIARPVEDALSAAARWVGAPVPPQHGFEEHTWRRSRPVLVRWGSLKRRAAHLESTDLRATPPYVQPLTAALTRFRGLRPRLAALRWVAFPSRTFLEFWSASRTSGSEPYGCLLVRRYWSLIARAFPERRK